MGEGSASVVNTKPNVIVIMTDQQRADVCGREGFPLDTTPFLDSLAAKGTWFDKAYTSMPICVPARTSFLTGRFPSAHQVRDNTSAVNASFQEDMFTTFRKQGYATALVGKNHTYLKPNEVCDYTLPFGHFGGTGSHRTQQEMEYDTWLSQQSQVGTAPSPFPVECQLPSRIVRASMDWIQSNGNNPFFLWMSFPEPHNPYQVPEPYFSMFPPEDLPSVQSSNHDREEKGFKWKWSRMLGEHFAPNYEELIPRARSNYFGMMRLIDDQVKRLHEFLISSSLSENTVIVFLSDHGDFVGEYGLIKKGPEMPEILFRIPLLFVGPEIKASALPHESHVSIVDIFPTLCELIGTEIPDGVQGRSLWPLLTGQDYPKREFSSVYGEHGFGGHYYNDTDPLDYDQCGSVNEQGVIRYDELNKYSQSGLMRSVRKGEWKLNVDMYGNIELYHISDDPLELRNVHGEECFGDIERDMLGTLATWLIRVQDPLPYPVNKMKYGVKTHPRNYLHID